VIMWESCKDCDHSFRATSLVLSEWKFTIQSQKLAWYKLRPPFPVPASDWSQSLPLPVITDISSSHLKIASSLLPVLCLGKWYAQPLSVLTSRNECTQLLMADCLPDVLYINSQA
jgi:hypothetical protein